VAPGPWSPHRGGEATTTPAASQAAGAGHHDGDGDDAGARATTAPAPAPDSDDARATNDDEAAEIMAIEAEVAAMAEIYDYNAARVQPLDHPAFTYPAIEEIAAAQEDALRRPGNPPALGTIPPRLASQAQDRIEVGDATTINGRTTRRTERGVVEVDVTSVQGKRYLPSQWRMWIPVARIDLHARLTVAAHGGLAAHQGMTPTLEELARDFYWRGMRDWVRHYVGRWVHCRTSNDIARIKRPFHASVTATAPNEVDQERR
jgi:hypothetical protein